MGLCTHSEHSLETVLPCLCVWPQSCHYTACMDSACTFFEKCPSLPQWNHSWLRSPAFFSGFVGPETTVLTHSLSTVPVVLPLGLAPPRLPLGLCTCSLASGTGPSQAAPGAVSAAPLKASLPLKLCLPHCWGYWAILCMDILSAQFVDSQCRAWTFLHVWHPLFGRSWCIHLEWDWSPFKYTIDMLWCYWDPCYVGLSDQPLLVVSHDNWNCTGLPLSSLLGY